MRFEDQVIVVTGASSGIGKQVSEDLIAEGASVAAIGKEEKKLTELKKFIGSSRLHTYQCDVSNEEEVKSTFKTIKKDIHLINCLVNSAGINPSRKAINETDIKDWKETLNVNLTGTFNCIKVAVNHMKELGSGSIVNISSIAGIVAMENRAAYSASKSGVIGLTKSVAIDYAASNIRVNCVSPGYVITPLVSGYIENLSKKEKKSLIESHLLGRLGSTQEVSKTILFLLSKDSSWTTGINLAVDGGFSLGKKI